MSEAIIQLDQLTKQYDETTAVNSLTMDIHRGEIFGLLGPNGAGKSTAILMMLGLTEPTKGSVKVCGIDSTRNPTEVKRRVGYLPDDVGFYEDMTGFENLVYTARINGVSAKESGKRAEYFLEKVGLGEAKEKKAGKYSRGMRQRLGLADVLIKHPEVIILDEPTLGIDPEGVRDFLEMIRSLSRDEGITVLLSSHHLHQVQEICDRVGLFVDGTLLAKGEIDRLAYELFSKEPYQFSIEASGITEECVERIRSLPSVERVAWSDPKLTIINNNDESHEMILLLIEEGARINQIEKIHYGLDEIYHRYFAGGETDGRTRGKDSTKT